MTDGRKTGWPPGLLQDDSRDLFRWFATRPDARQVLGTVTAEISAQAAARVVAVALSVRHQRGEGSTPMARVMAGAMGALAQISQRGFRWKTTDAVAIDVGLQHAVETYCNATAKEVNSAHQHVTRLEAQR